MSEIIGQLQEDDPLYGFLATEVLRIGIARPIFDVYALNNSSVAYRYQLRSSELSVVGKFYGNKWINGCQNGHYQLRAELMRREFANLATVSALGLDEPVRPLAMNAEISYVLFEEFAPGISLYDLIRNALERGETDVLFVALDHTAHFLAKLHNRLHVNSLFNPNDDLAHLRRVADDLVRWRIIDAGERTVLLDLCRSWDAYFPLRPASAVLIHGDATPLHFLFDADHRVKVVDWERLQAGDRAMDLGYLAAEIKHVCTLHANAPRAGEPYISHIYHRYTHYADGQAGPFEALTDRGRFYMGLCLLQMCRNDWLELDYRRHLLLEAKSCLTI